MAAVPHRDLLEQQKTQFTAKPRIDLSFDCNSNFTSDKTMMDKTMASFLRSRNHIPKVYRCTDQMLTHGMSKVNHKKWLYVLISARNSPLPSLGQNLKLLRRKNHSFSSYLKMLSNKARLPKKTDAVRKLLHREKNSRALPSKLFFASSVFTHNSLRNLQRVR